ncbi:hypothetical protein J2D73_07805 [Acetobacter sacchari]|uniref:Uncharacterized protein n=1 Tax=Acetobacter sacchari TaxID=2661687 RepID=A0ABS3LUW8_9PROT|nr:hypothetical protein [Acetobacter sacchari]MBO1359698.1 hypothetical protein [Acetobacter sacchari]
MSIGNPRFDVIQNHQNRLPAYMRDSNEVEPYLLENDPAAAQSINHSRRAEEVNYARHNKFLLKKNKHGVQLGPYANTGLTPIGKKTPSTTLVFKDAGGVKEFENSISKEISISKINGDKFMIAVDLKSATLIQYKMDGYLMDGSYSAGGVRVQIGGVLRSGVATVNHLENAEGIN